MCEYSLELYAATDAQQGATYELHRFPSGTLGFKAREGDKTKAGADAVCACVTPGSLLSLDYPDGKCEVAIFTKLDTESKHMHRDGLILSGGKNVTLQTLQAGIKATILMLAARDAKEDAELASVLAEPVPYDPAYVLAY